MEELKNVAAVVYYCLRITFLVFDRIKKRKGASK